MHQPKLFDSPTREELLLPLLFSNNGSTKKMSMRDDTSPSPEDKDGDRGSFSDQPIRRFENTSAERLRPVASMPGTRDQSEGQEDRFTTGAVYHHDEEKRRESSEYRLTHSTGSHGVINRDPGDRVYYEHDQNRTKFEEATLYVREGELNDKFFNHPTGRWSKMAYKILQNPIFHIFDLSLTVLLMMLAFIEKPSVFGDEPSEHPLLIVHGLLELLLLGLLGVDIVLRLIWLSPYHFVRHRRTMFITLILCVMIIEAFVVLGRQESHVRITRALRPLFFIDTYLMFGVRRVLRQIFQSLKVIVDVILLLLFVVAFFALIGYYLYAEVDPAFFQTFGLSFVSLFITTTTANNPDVMMEAYSIHKASPIFFFVFLVLTLYFINNILLAVVISNFSEEEKEKFRKLFLHKREALRHAYRVLTSSSGIVFDDFLTFMQQYRPRMPEWQVMCVFKALHRNPNDQHSELSLKEFYDFYEVQNLKWREITEGGDDLTWFEKFPIPIKRVFQKIHALVKWEWFNSIIYIVIICNMVFLVIFTALITEQDAHSRFKHINIALPVSFFFLLLYIIEIVLKLLALGPIQYFKKFWNMCDFVVILVSLVALCLEIHPLYHHLAIVRPIKLIRIVRLKKRYRDIMNTMVVLTPRLISVSLLLVVVYYFFAILGMEAFQYRVHQGCCENASYSVGTYYAGFINSSHPDPDVYYLNNFDNIFRSFVTLFTLMVVNNWFIIMEGFASEVRFHWAARIYFFAFYIVTFVVLQVVISFIVEAFNIQLEHSSHREQQKKKRKLLGRNFQFADDTDCVEDEHRKKEVRITLLNEDIKKLNYVITLSNERRRIDKEAFSVDLHVKKIRRIKLPEDCEAVMQCSGRRLRTKDDLNLMKFRAEIEQWIQEQDDAFQQLERETSVKKNTRNWKDKAKVIAKKIMVYLLE